MSRPKKATIGILTTTTVMVGGLAPAATWADTVPCDPATGCVPTPPQTPTPPPAPDPAPSAPPGDSPAPVLELPAKVTKISVTIRKSDNDSFRAFQLRVRWSGGLHASSFLVRLQKVSFQPLEPGDSATKQGQFYKLKSEGWEDTQGIQPKRWLFSVPQTTTFYRVQVRGQNSRGAGPIAEQYLLVTTHNEKAITFKPGN